MLTERNRRHIKLLPVAVANKIAAGEVVERPASVVKEFLENSFDAEATRIEVTVVSGGRKLISIADNGIGMNRDDALMCLEQQATSKINDVDDIERISTYGFRGEAVPSVASVSRMLIRTCAEGESSGTCIQVDGGVIRSVSTVGFPQGTTFEIRDLFFNVPARRKFLRSYATEQAHIRTVFTFQAIAHPEVAMKLRADGRELIQLAGNATLKERLHDLFGASFLDSMREVFYEGNQVTVRGFVGLPTLTRADRGEQYIFVNRRAATAAVIPFALREAYPPLEGDRKPVVVLFIEVPPTEVDVNVHPTKREVRFRDARAVRDTIILAIQKALGIGSFSPNYNEDPQKTAEEPLPPVQPVPLPSPPAGPCGGTLQTVIPPIPQTISGPCGGMPSQSPRQDFAYQPPRQRQGQFQTLLSQSTNLNSRIAPPTEPIQQTAAPSLAAPNPTITTPGNSAHHSLWEWCRILGQIKGGYVLMETDDGYVVMDPRAAHERILYERMLAESEGREIASQSLLLPQTVTLPAEDANLILENLSLMHSAGFGIEPFGDNSFVIEALPNGVKLLDVRSLLLDICHGISESGPRRGVLDWKLQAIARAAAHSAVSRMADIPYQGLSALIENLAATKMPYTSPQGRPTMFFTATRELDRKFGIFK